jgi:hypothetical protein
MSDSEASVFNFDIDEEAISLPHPKQTKYIYERACAWTFQDRWHCSHNTVCAASARFEDRKTNTIQEFKRRIICIMGEELLSEIHFISIVLNCDSLESECEEYEIPLRCYIQTNQIRKSALQSRFQANASWEPIKGGLYSSRSYRDDERIDPPWVKCDIHGEIRENNAQKRQVS